jgi:hypothetical protein
MHRFLPLLATFAVIAVNAAANIVPINGVQTGELSARYPTGFTPAGWVFSIWSLIYIGLIAFSVYASRPAGLRNARVARILPAYYASCVGNAVWIFMWHYELIGASLACMLVILVSLVVVYLQLFASEPRELAERWCMDAPFSLYLGWITTATLANFATWFYDLQRWPFDLAMEEWALLTVVAATAVYTAIGVRTGDAIYTLVFVWAALGIVLQTLEISAAVRLAAAAGCAVALVVSFAAAAGGPLTVGRASGRGPPA